MEPNDKDTMLVDDDGLPTNRFQDDSQTGLQFIWGTIVLLGKDVWSLRGMPRRGLFCFLYVSFMFPRNSLNRQATRGFKREGIGKLNVLKGVEKGVV